ncbi:MAG: protein kinase [Dechloromonas sp.]|nr:MAG: protein kinase [Dechloromonas sp.]
MWRRSLCEDQHLQRKVAIKFLQDPATDMRRLLDELRALLLMRSKHVVQVLDIVPSGSELIGIVEEFIDGEDLWNSKIPLSPTQFLKTLWQIACGIADIHAFGIIHRDIKPNNMKFDPEGIVKIFDFGLARDEAYSRNERFCWHSGIRRPELYSHSKVTFTNEVDVYAFGASAAF